MSSNREKIIQAILELCAQGNQGNLHDFSRWLWFEYKLECNETEIDNIFAELVQKNLLMHHGEILSEYLQTDACKFLSKVEYFVSSDIKSSPIQFVRSRLESFLKFHNTSNTDIIDISIATTEAMENAVKYSNEKKIKVMYSIDGNKFHICMENEIKNTVPEDDILSGKYSGSITLMRGMMVMVKLLTEVDIDIDEDRNIAIFRGNHILKNRP